MKTQSDYPKFISNRPCGKDMFLGKSQERIAKALADHIQNEGLNIKDNKEKDEHCLPHIIGLEGGWGSGKSNLIKILKNNFLQKTHYVFEYDAWGHQEDLHKRSFLETLTDELIQEKQLPGKTKIFQDNKKKRITWKKKLEYLLARTRKTNTRTIPKLSFAIIIAIILLIVTPITTSIASEDYFGKFWNIILYLAPIIILFIYGIYVVFSDKTFAELFAVYSGEKIKDTVYETISEKEPSVNEFNKWMFELSADLKQKLVIVFDNMDRLPAHRVKELWSSIHTFFAEVPYPKIWVIITFDKNHLANAFNELEGFANPGEAKALTTHFINKTFPVIYRVASPIISDFKKIFHEYIDKAFGKNNISNKERNYIRRIFGIIKPNPTVRDIIAFINEVVSLKKTWKEDISLSHISTFVLTKDKIINGENTISENILSNEYYSSIARIIIDYQELQESISALAYNINKEDAKQIPITQYLINLFNIESNTDDINTYSVHKYFLDVLLEIINDIDVILIDRAIKIIDGLKTDVFDNEEKLLKDIWDELTTQKTKQNIESVIFRDIHKIILNKGRDANKKSLLKYLCKNFQIFEKKNGADYYLALSQMDEFIEELKFKYDIPSQLKEKIVLPKIFIKYVEKAQDQYRKYKLNCDNSKLNNYLVDLLPDQMKHTNFFDYCADNGYDFSDFYKKLEEAIPNLTEDNFYFLNTAYKSLSKSKPLDVLLEQNQIQSIQSAISDYTIKGYFDISAMALGLNIGTTVDASDDKIILEIAKRIEYYHNFGTLLRDSVPWNNPVLNKVLFELTTNPPGDSVLEIIEILPLFEQLTSSLKIESNALFDRLDTWSKDAENDIDKDNISQIVLHALYSHSVQIKNDLTNHIHKVAKVRLSEIDTQTLLQNKDLPSFYWLATAEALINGNVLRALPDNLVEFVKNIFVDISNTGSIPNDAVTTIINKAAPSKITATIKNIGNEYYGGRKTINPEIFKFFEPYFRDHDRIKNREGDFTRTILDTVVSDNACRELILQNKQFYAKIVKIAGDDAENLKIKIKGLCQSEPSDELNKFSDLIGVKIDNDN